MIAYRSSIGAAMNNDELIDIAAGVLKPRAAPGGRLSGDVGAVVVSANGRHFTGVSVDTPSWGLCAERSALAAMVTAGEYNFRRVAAVWRDDSDGRLYVLPPCGHCREFMRALDEANLEAEVVLGRTESAPLRELLPRHAWPAPLD